MGRKLVRQTRWAMELDSGEYDARIRQERAPGVQVLFSVVKRRAETVAEKGQVSIHYNAGANSAEMLMKTIVSVSQLRNYRALLTWYFERSGGGDNISPNATQSQNLPGTKQDSRSLLKWNNTLWPEH